MEHLGTVRLETERLDLRPFQLTDAPYLYKNWASDPEVVKYLTWSVHDSVNFSEKLIEQWIQNYRDLSHYHWAIVLKEIDEPIGSISVVDQKGTMVHIGYCMGKKWWNRGLMTEALREIVRFFLEDVGVYRVESEFDSRNIGSGRVMEKSGLIYEKEFKDKTISNLGPGTSVLMSINRKQWNERSV